MSKRRYRKQRNTVDRRIHNVETAQEAKAIMEKRWQMPGVADADRPARWYSARHGNDIMGYQFKVEPET